MLLKVPIILLIFLLKGNHIDCFRLLHLNQINAKFYRPNLITTFSPSKQAIPFYSRLTFMSQRRLQLSIVEQNFIQASIVHGILYTLLRSSSQQSLTKEGLKHGAILGTGLWTFLGWKGWLICIAYLVLGSLATKVKISEKERLGIAEKRHGARGPENLWGSAAAAMVSAIGTYVFPQFQHLFLIAYVASLTTKLADTFSSELGKAYGKTTYLITTLKLVPKGTEGAVSLEGTIAGILGAVLMSSLAVFLNVLANRREAIICIISAFVATTIESYLGATLQSRGVEWISNEMVNLIMTIIGAAIAILLGLQYTP